MRVGLNKVFVLHRRSFRETSLIVDIFSREHGRVSAIARGIKTAKSRWRGILQPFTPFLASWQGKSDLKVLCAAEPVVASFFLQQKELAAGFYLNELLVGFLKVSDPHPTLFDAYEDVLREFSLSGLQERALRLFEKIFLAQVGYGLEFSAIIGSKFMPLSVDMMYKFYPNRGFVQCDKCQEVGNAFSGCSLLSFANNELKDSASLQAAKRLIRLALAALPGAKSLQSRRLFG